MVNLVIKYKDNGKKKKTQNLPEKAKIVRKLLWYLNSMRSWTLWRLKLKVIMHDLEAAHHAGLKFHSVENDSMIGLIAINEVNKGLGSKSHWFGIISDIIFFSNSCDVFLVLFMS